MKLILLFCIVSASSTIHAQPAAYSVVISEIFADPTPAVQLPEKEWIELHNILHNDIDLQGWKIGDATGTSGAMPSHILKADSFVIVCAAGSVASLSAFGPTIAVTSFPSLGNEGDLLFIRSPGGATIHAVNYKDSWYQNELKRSGGWSLEMIDSFNPCSGASNWKASVDAKGGTPGRKNSVEAINSDQTSPKLLRAFVSSPTEILLTFDEPLDSTKAAIRNSYVVSDGVIINEAVPVAPLFDAVKLKLATALGENKINTITVNALSDCSGNIISNNLNIAKVGLTSPAVAFDIIVNEILFNPKPSSVDYVELYNRSKKIINLKNISLANRNSLGVIGNIIPVSNEDRAFFPGEYICVTENIEAVKKEFVMEDPDAFIEVATPSYNDDKGNVVLLNEQGLVLDEISYNDGWHFALISNKEGVALERINYNDTSIIPAKQQKNWHSAASAVNYGTPGYKNSQYLPYAALQGTITVTPNIISPDNDGRDDIATISYTFPEPGYVSSITIFDAVGRPVRYLQRNALNGIQGYYRWDGLGDKQQQLPVGLYIIYIEIFNLNGKTRKFKNSIVLAK